MEPVFQESTSKFTNKKLMETLNYLERENDDLRERIYDLENSITIHKNISFITLKYQNKFKLLIKISN